MGSEFKVGFKALRDGVTAPRYGHSGDGAVDLTVLETVALEPFERLALPLGFALEMPADAIALILPRSGISLNTSIILPNSPGLIDPNYKGEVAVIVANIDPKERCVIETGTRIAQMLFLSRTGIEFYSIDALSDSTRGSGGFGSTGYR